MTLRERIREQPLPGEAEAAARSWPVVEAALAERVPAQRPRRLVLRLALVAALLSVGLVAALTPAGAEVGDWIGDRFSDRGDSAPAFAGLPPGRSVLAISGSGAYAIHADGSWRRLGPFSDAGWSPHGLHVVGVAGHRVVAMDPAGMQKWSVARPGRVHHPAWSTGDGFLVAYLEGNLLRLVGGNGAGDRPLRRARGGGGHAGVAAARTPRPRVRGRGRWARGRRWGQRRHALACTDRTRPRAPVVARRESARGALVACRHGARRPWSRASQARASGLGSPARAAPIRQAGGRGGSGAAGTRVLDVPLGGAGRPRQLFQGDVAGLAWSHDGRRLLLAWRDADQWLLLGSGGRVRRALHGVSGELGPAGGFPRLAGWCCAG